MPLIWHNTQYVAYAVLAFLAAAGVTSLLPAPPPCTATQIAAGGDSSRRCWGTENRCFTLAWNRGETCRYVEARYWRELDSSVP